jgi:hypothetical protein
LLRDAGVQVYDISIQPWRFDSARNTALNLVPTAVDLCVTIDMDEVPDPDFWDKLRKQWKKGSNRGWIYMDTGTVWTSDRIHARHGFHWKYPIHEVTAPSMGTKVVSCAIDATIRHKPDNNKSRAQYLTMLEQAVESEPDQRMLVYLVREYGYHKRYEDVIRVAQEVEEGWDVERSSAWRNAGDACFHLGRKEEALTWYEAAAKTLPKEPEPWVALAQYHYFEKNWQECIYAAAQGIATLPQKHYLNQPDSMWKLYDFASLSAWELGMHQVALRHAERAYSINKDKRIKDNITFYKNFLRNS